MWAKPANAPAMTAGNNKLLTRVLGSIYLRNLVLLLLLLASSTATKVYTLRSFDLMGFFNICMASTSIYLTFIFHNTVLYEKLWRGRKYLLYFIILTASLISLDQLLLPAIRKLVHIPWENGSYSAKLLVLYTRFINTYIALAVYIAFSFYKEHEKQLKLENLNREIELKQLKEQLNPHFLFNALNNIYSYTLENSSSTGELLLKLSELIRYILRTSNTEEVSLEDEISFIKHYIAFEQERLGARCKVEIITDITDLKTKIAPFVLFTFIENAFKHGTATNERSEIRIDIHADKERIDLQIVNSIHRSKQHSTKVGLANVQRRLQLIYPERHTLSLTEENGFYHTQLVLKYQ